MNEQQVVAALAEDEAWEFLRRHQFGRLAYHLVGEVHIVPLNYAVSQRYVLFRTAPGSKLLGIVMNENVAFEVDRVDDDNATSVVVRGVASLLRDTAADRADALLVPSWVPTDKDEIVAIDVREISGRKFQLDRRP
jgi:nitroimidazol reductase NimA-like FMN-containing flavoprotein (pyridoxamine 5'-phosphate oxidase superfamily)